ncbi:hypothetical protein GCM10010517_07570 [Streptosporangium fragile]|uniref:Ig-like domain-containing protein n=1 Tax=Streptosporangium fragile TaxID=46186 RepID=A0ABP6I6Q9_9ACTN
MKPWWKVALTAITTLSLSAGALTGPAQAAAPAVKVAAVKASPARYTGSCPASTVFSATVSVKGATRLTYRWVRSDGSKGAVKTVRAGASVTVRDQRTFTGTTRGWQAVQVLSPKKLTSKRAYFSVTCEGGPGDSVVVVRPKTEPAPPKASAEVTVSGSSGTCPTPGRTLTFTGTVRVSRVPAAVTYRWVDSDGGALGTERLWFSAKDSTRRTVTSSRTFLAGQSGTRWIEILDPDGKVLSTSGKAPYRVTCTPPSTPTPPPATATVSDLWVSPETYQGECVRPLEFTFKAVISASKATKVTYKWIRSDGTTVPGEADLRDGDLTKIISLPWQVADPTKVSGGSARVQITSPGNVTTAPVKFAITCVTLTISEAKVASPAQPYTGTCPVTVRTTATVTVTGGSAAVWYGWKYPGTSARAEVISGSKTFTMDWPVGATSTGSTAFHAATADGYNGTWKESAPITWSVTCKAAEPDGITVSEAKVTTWSRDPGPCTTQNPYQLTAAAMVTAPKGMTYPLTVSYRWRWDDGGYWHEEKLTFTEPGTQRAAHRWSASRSKAAKVWLEVLTPARVQGEAGEYSVTCDGKPPAPNPGGKILSVTNPTITPSAHTGPCPVDLKASATITVSAPISGPVEYVWQFDNDTSSPIQSVEFPSGGPLTKTVEWKNWRAVKTSGKVTGYLQVLTPNTAVSEPVSYSVTCA